MTAQLCNPDLEIPKAWRTITRIHQCLAVACPDVSAAVPELNEWINWWMPAYQAAEGLSLASMARMRSAGWWPPHVVRNGDIPEVVAASRQRLLYWNSRRRIDDRSRAFHRAIGSMLEQNPQWIDRARARAADGAAVHRESGLTDSPLNHWLKILGYPIEHVIETISYDSERMDYLRPYSPFTGVLPKAIRMDILNAFSKPDPESLVETENETST